MADRTRLRDWGRGAAVGGRQRGGGRAWVVHGGRRPLAAIELRAAGWLDWVKVEIFEGPNEYLYGEETAMLEAIDGRPPFPLIASHIGMASTRFVDRVVAIHSSTASATHVELAGPGPDSVGSPTLVNNVETLASVPVIVAEGPEWFRWR